jgi:redox-sensitive bicupin YhaK (pirin superfamily)
VYEGLASKIPNYSREFLYHIHLGPYRRFVVSANEGYEYAAFTVGPHMVLNDTVHEAAEFIELDRSAGTIELVNNSDLPNDLILFGGERYTEPIVADGPFVMNTHAEIAQAYLDLHEGKYGTIVKVKG